MDFDITLTPEEAKQIAFNPSHDVSYGMYEYLDWMKAVNVYIDSLQTDAEKICELTKLMTISPFPIHNAVAKLVVSKITKTPAS